MIDRAKQFIKNARGIIFDMDGLLIDSERFWREAERAMILLYGDPETIQERVDTRGTGIREAVIKLKQAHKLKGDVDTLMRAHREGLYALLFADNGLSLLPGVEAFLETIAQRPIGLATGGHTPEKIWEILQKGGIHEYFRVVVSCDEVERGKPFPDVYLEAARRLDILPSGAIVLEDAPNGVRAGRAAGMVVIGIHKEKEVQEQLYDAGADVVAGSLEELV